MTFGDTITPKLVHASCIDVQKGDLWNDTYPDPANGFFVEFTQDPIDPCQWGAGAGGLPWGAWYLHAQGGGVNSQLVVLATGNQGPKAVYSKTLAAMCIKDFGLSDLVGAADKFYHAGTGKISFTPIQQTLMCSYHFSPEKGMHYEEFPIDSTVVVRVANPKIPMNVKFLVDRNEFYK